MSSRAGPDGCEKLAPHRDLTPEPSSPQRVAIPTTPSRKRLPKRALFSFLKNLLILSNSLLNTAVVIQRYYILFASNV
jgi:hypothetical protein